MQPLNFRKQARPIERLYLDLDQEDGICGRRPLDVHNSFRFALQNLHMFAVDPVDGDADAAGDETRDGVARDGGATAREFDPHVVNALNDHVRVAAAAAALLTGHGGFGEVLFSRVLATESAHESAHDGSGCDMHLPDRYHERVS